MKPGDKGYAELIRRMSTHASMRLEQMSEGYYHSIRDDDPDSVTGWKHDRHVLIWMREHARSFAEMAEYFENLEKDSLS